MQGLLSRPRVVLNFIGVIAIANLVGVLAGTIILKIFNQNLHKVSAVSNMEAVLLFAVSGIPIVVAIFLSFIYLKLYKTKELIIVKAYDLFCASLLAIAGLNMISRSQRLSTDLLLVHLLLVEIVIISLIQNIQLRRYRPER
jgi:hypothetical protein